MKFAKSFYKPWLACGDGDRPIFRYVNVDAVDDTNGIISASDGFILAVVPCTLEEGDVPGLLHYDAIKHAASVGGHVLLGTDRLRFPQDDSDYPRKTTKGEYPNWKQLLPKVQTVPVTIPFALNPELLDRVWKAIGKPYGVSVTAIREGVDAPLLIENTEPKKDGLPVPPFGLVMQMQLRGNFVREVAK